MNILHLYKDYFPVLGGIENHIKVLAEAQAAAGHTVMALVTNPPGAQTTVNTENGVRVVRAGRLGTVASTPLSTALPRWLMRERPDVIHLHFPYPFGDVAHALFGRARRTIITYHSDIVRQKSLLRLYAPFLRRSLARADRIIATSPGYVESSPWLRPVREKCVVIPLGIDVERFTPADSHHADPPTLLFVGRLRYYKGLDTLLHALPCVPDARLTIVGDGPMGGPWETLSHELGLADRVNFVGDIDDADLPAFYQQADLFVLPANARAEAYGLVLLEAMASGLPCITTELGTGTSWIVQDGVTGLVVPPMDPPAMSEAIAALLRDPVRRQAMGRAGRERVEQLFSVEQMISKVESLYEGLLL